MIPNRDSSIPVSRYTKNLFMSIFAALSAFFILFPPLYAAIVLCYRYCTHPCYKYERVIEFQRSISKVHPDQNTLTDPLLATESFPESPDTL